MPHNSSAPPPAALSLRRLQYGVGVGTGAIKHPEWSVNRVGFQPYPFKSATHEIVRLLKETKIEGNSEFLQELDPDEVIKQLFDYDLVTNAIEKSGGLTQFQGINPEHPFEREEVIVI